MKSLSQTVDLLQVLGEPNRVRLLALLAQKELTVAELTSITELAQSRVSTHLAKLRDAGFLHDRKVGASTYYALNDGAMPREAKALWALLRAELEDDLLASDARRLAALLRAREKESRWPDTVAGQMERYYSPGRTWEAYAHGLLGLMQLGDVLDVGSGDGVVAQLLLPRCETLTCLDISDKMIAAAKVRLMPYKNARFAVGDLQRLPFADASFDQVLLFNVLTHAEGPERALAEAARVMRAGAALALVTLDAHTHADVTQAYHHLHPGFSTAQLRRMLVKAGLEVAHCGVTSRERQKPHFDVITASAHKPQRLKGKGK